MSMPMQAGPITYRRYGSWVAHRAGKRRDCDQRDGRVGPNGHPTRVEADRRGRTRHLSESLSDTTVYVRLLNEDVEVWRPVRAELLGRGCFRINPSEPYDRDLEEWEFAPGQTVYARPTALADGEALTAVSPADPFAIELNELTDLCGTLLTDDDRWAAHRLIDHGEGGEVLTVLAAAIARAHPRVEPNTKIARSEGSPTWNGTGTRRRLASRLCRHRK